MKFDPLTLADFDDVEVDGLVPDGADGFERANPGDVPARWGVYLHARQGGCWWIADFATEADAVRFARAIRPTVAP